MAYVQRNSDGAIIGQYSCMQPGIADEWLDDADAATAALNKPLLLAQLNAGCAQRLATLTTGYPAGERDSWAKQEAEARALLASSTASTPLLSAIASARGIAVADLASRVVAKADAFAAAAGAIIGHRQALEQAIHDAENTAALQAIDITAGWTGA